MPRRVHAIQVRLEVPEDASDAEPKVGDVVRLGLGERALTAAAAWAYGMPLAGLIGGAVSVAVFAPGVGDAWVAFGALAGLVVGVATARIGSVFRCPVTPVLLGSTP